MLPIWKVSHKARGKVKYSIRSVQPGSEPTTKITARIQNIRELN